MSQSMSAEKSFQWMAFPHRGRAKSFREGPYTLQEALQEALQDEELEQAKTQSLSSTLSSALSLEEKTQENVKGGERPLRSWPPVDCGRRARPFLGRRGSGSQETRGVRRRAFLVGRLLPRALAETLSSHTGTVPSRPVSSSARLQPSIGEEWFPGQRSLAEMSDREILGTLFSAQVLGSFSLTAFALAVFVVLGIF